MVIGQCQKTQVCGVLRAGRDVAPDPCVREIFAVIMDFFFLSLKIANIKYRHVYIWHSFQKRHKNVKFVRNKETCQNP